MRSGHLVRLCVLALGLVVWMSSPARAQGAGGAPDEPPSPPEAPDAPPQPGDGAEDPAAPAPAPEPAPAPTPEPAPAPEPAPVPELAPAPAGPAPLRIHVITTQNTYERMGFDVFDVNTRELVASGKSADESVGEVVASFDLPEGTYKIVRSGEPIDTRVDFATVQHQGGTTDYVIVVDPQTGAFRGSGLVTEELPEGVDIAGVRVALNVGGNLWLNHQKSVIGTTNGLSSLMGLFGNFSLVMSEGNHFLAVDSNLQINVRDQERASYYSTTDFFEGSALYAFNINNDYVGPYARASFKTRVTRGYLYLEEDDAATGTVTVNRLDGSTDVFTFGGQANIDNLRIETAKPFAPFILQEELGGNLKAVDLNLRLLELSVATRLGWAFRQGLTNELLVVSGSTGETGADVVLNEVDDYFTMGPTVGANATVTFARWLFGQGNFGMVAPVQDTDRAGPDFASRLLIDLSATGGFKVPVLTDLLYASADYTLRVQRDGYLTRATMLDQVVMARASLQLF